VLAAASVNIAFNCDLVNSTGCLTLGLRDTFFATGRAQVANNAGLRFGTGLILGFAVGSL
jgi:hypothetical protein